MTDEYQSELRFLKNILKIQIEIRSKLFPQIYENEDIRREVVQRLHEAFFNVIEKKVAESDDIEDEVMDVLKEDRLPDNVQGFTDLGEIALSISKETDEIKQKSLHGKTLEDYLKR